MLLRCLVDMNFVEAMRAVGRTSTGCLSLDGTMLTLPLGLLGTAMDGMPRPDEQRCAARLVACWNALLGLPDSLVKGMLVPGGSVMSVLDELAHSRATQGGAEVGMLMGAVGGQWRVPMVPISAKRVRGHGGSHPILTHALFADGRIVLHQMLSKADAQRLALCWNALMPLDATGISGIERALDLLCTLALARHAGRGQGTRIGDKDYEACVLGQLLVSERIQGGGYVVASGMTSAAARLARTCGEAAHRMLPERLSPAWSMPPQPVELC